jgi:hypothetical protein
MEEKAAGGVDSKLTEKKAQETGAEAPESPQEQSELVVVIGGQIMVLATPAVQDFVRVDIITGGTPVTVLERAKAKGDLVDILLSRSNLTSEQIDVLNTDSLMSKRIIGSVLMQKLFGQTA